MRKTLFLGAGGKTEKMIEAVPLDPGAPQEEEEITTLDMQPPADCIFDLNTLHIDRNQSELVVTGDRIYLAGYLPFPDDEFDEIHAYEVLEHFGRQGDWKGFFQEWGEYYRVLKPGGMFAFSVPAGDANTLWGDPGHCRVITPVTMAFLCHHEYERQLADPKSPMTDYRQWLVGNWTAVSQVILNKNKDRWGMALKSLPVPDTISLT